MRPLRGSLHLAFTTCGDPRCRCLRGGERHGPYNVHMWREAGRQRKKHVAAGDLNDVRAGVELWRKQHPPLRSFRDQLAALRRRAKELTNA